MCICIWDAIVYIEVDEAEGRINSGGVGVGRITHCNDGFLDNFKLFHDILYSTLLYFTVLYNLSSILYFNFIPREGEGEGEGEEDGEGCIKLNDNIDVIWNA